MKYYKSRHRYILLKIWANIIKVRNGNPVGFILHMRALNTHIGRMHLIHI